MKSLDIVFDVDGVIGDIMSLVISLYNEEYKLNLKLEDVITGNLVKVQNPGTSLVKYFDEEFVFEHMKPYLGALNLVKRLVMEGHNVFICTAIPWHAVMVRGNWLLKNFPMIDEDNIMFVKNKKLVKGDVFIDDGIHNLVTNDSEVKILFSRSWNLKISEKYFNDVESIIRVDEETAYEDIYSIVRLLSNGEHIVKTNYLKVVLEDSQDEKKMA